MLTKKQQFQRRLQTAACKNTNGVLKQIRVANKLPFCVQKVRSWQLLLADSPFYPAPEVYMYINVKVKLKKY